MSGPIGAASCRSRRSDSWSIAFHGFQKKISRSVHPPAPCGGKMNSFFWQPRSPCWLLVPPRGIMRGSCMFQNLKGRDEAELLCSLPWHSMEYWCKYLRYAAVNIQDSLWNWKEWLSHIILLTLANAHAFNYFFYNITLVIFKLKLTKDIKIKNYWGKLRERTMLACNLNLPWYHENWKDIFVVLITFSLHSASF